MSTHVQFNTKSVIPGDATNDVFVAWLCLDRKRQFDLDLDRYSHDCEIYSGGDLGWPISLVVEVNCRIILYIVYLVLTRELFPCCKVAIREDATGYSIAECVPSLGKWLVLDFRQISPFILSVIDGITTYSRFPVVDHSYSKYIHVLDHKDSPGLVMVII